MANSKIVFGFPGVGKTYCFAHQKELGLKLVDSDSSMFHWVYDLNGNPCLDEDGNKREHPEWPMNYIKYVTLIGKEKAEKPDYILMSTHEDVMNAMKDSGFDMILVVPGEDEKDNMMRLYKERGNDEKFIEMMDKKYDEYRQGAIVRAVDLSAIGIVAIHPFSVAENVYANLFEYFKYPPKDPMEFEK